MARLHIEDPEGNFLYLNVRYDDGFVILETINAASNGKAKIERDLELEEIEELERKPIADLVSQWHATAELNDGAIELTIYRTDDPGPMKEWRETQVLLLDEAHATELLGTLALALEQRRKVEGTAAG